MAQEIGSEPTPEELAEKLVMPIAQVRKLLNIARQPVGVKPRSALHIAADLCSHH